MADDNDSLKYARYAIGEIVLVVIGILIALSINNWNENRKLKVEEQTYLENIKTDLQLNVTALNEFITSREVSNKSAKSILQYFEGEKAINYLDFNKQSINIMIWFPFEQNDNTFQELINSGKLSILSNKKIKNALQNIKSSFNKITFVENEMQQDYETYLYEPYFTIADLNTSIKLIEISSEKLKEVNQPQIDILLENQKFKNGFTLSIFNSDVLIEEYSLMLATTERLINLIDSELKL